MATPAAYDPNSNPLMLLDVIKTIGPKCLGWKPETLFAHIDTVYGQNHTGTTIANALDKFHETGEIQTDVPELVRQKIYAIRIILTSDTAHNEWHVFEKIGAAFNGRLAHFGVVEPLSPIECAKTIAMIDAIRPDAFSNEIKAYIAASCHQDGLYTIKPSKYLKIAAELLTMMNTEETGRPINDTIVDSIMNRLTTISSGAPIEDFIGIQAAKLLAIDASADEFIKSV